MWYDLRSPLAVPLYFTGSVEEILMARRLAKYENDGKVWVQYRIDRDLHDRFKKLVARTGTSRGEAFEAAVQLLLERAGRSVLESGHALDLLEEIATTLWYMAYRRNTPRVRNTKTNPARQKPVAPETPRRVQELREASAVNPEVVPEEPDNPPPLTNRIQKALERRAVRMAHREALERGISKGDG